MSFIILWSWLHSGTSNWMWNIHSWLPLLTSPRLHRNSPCGHLLGPSRLSLVLATFGHITALKSPQVQFRFNIRVNFHERIHPSSESPAREQPQTSYRAHGGDLSSWQMYIWAEWSTTPPGTTSKELAGKSKDLLKSLSFVMFAF